MSGGAGQWVWGRVRTWAGFKPVRRGRVAHPGGPSDRTRRSGAAGRGRGRWWESGELPTLSPDFRNLWAAHDVRIRHDGVKRLRHPEVGDLELTYQSLDLPMSDRAVHDLTLYTAEPGSTSEDRLKLLASLAATQSQAAQPTDRLG
ncbi:hypothetical protein [Streptomyces sp. NPDC056660]|uniref:MmyB family transcriptional regulator n=1 Tax=Streptomyces sp. NPDC056660 TaxID=3345897 RepID=UPI00368AAA59